MTPNSYFYTTRYRNLSAEVGVRCLSRFTDHETARKSGEETGEYFVSEEKALQYIGDEDWQCNGECDYAIIV